MRARPKTVSFYHLRARGPGGVRDVDQCAWRGLLHDWAEARPILANREVEGVVFNPDDSKPLAAVGLHRVLDRSFLSLLNARDSTVADALDKEGDEQVATSSACVFLDDLNIVALAWGNMQAPRISALEPFLREVAPLDPPLHWTAVPVMSRGALDRFLRSDGVVSFETSFSTRQNLTTPESPSGLASEMDRIAKQIGSDLNMKGGSNGVKSPEGRVGSPARL